MRVRVGYRECFAIDTQIRAELYGRTQYIPFLSLQLLPSSFCLPIAAFVARNLLAFIFCLARDLAIPRSQPRFPSQSQYSLINNGDCNCNECLRVQDISKGKIVRIFLWAKSKFARENNRNDIIVFIRRVD